MAGTKPTKRTVSDIKSNLLRPATTSHFEVEIPLPSGLTNNLGIQKDKLQLMCDSASLPGSNLATLDINNDYAGVTEKHVHRRVFDDRIDLSFYVDAGNYLPIRFFESWMEYITNGRNITPRDNVTQLMQSNYFYRMSYPDDYIAGQGLIVRKFEKDYNGMLEYEFVRSFPLAISSMPVSYDGSALLKCNVSFSYIRYVIHPATPSGNLGSNNPFQQSEYNNGGLSGLLGNVADAAVTTITGNRFLGDLAGAATRIFT
tara:strand:+ start:159 stop:932 length:774 start_codon:yes stop_codon:yes gene_type:complete